jgi:hypothetical protein
LVGRLFFAVWPSWLDAIFISKKAFITPRKYKDPWARLTLRIRPNTSANPLATGALSDVQVEQSTGRTDKYRQFVLAVDDARDDPDDLFDRAHSADHPGETPDQ